MKVLDIYPDELFYSYMARYRVRMNHLSYQDFSKRMFVYTEVRPECLFTNTLRPEMFEEISAQISWQEIIDQHTMIPEYRFEAKEKFERGYRILM